MVAEQGSVARRSENMDISVDAPNELTEVSNGRFQGKTDLHDGYTRWDWHVRTPSTTTMCR